MQGVVVKSEVDEEVFKLQRNTKNSALLQAQLRRIIVLD